MMNGMLRRAGAMLAIVIGSSLSASADALYKLTELGSHYSTVYNSIDNQANVMDWKADPLPTGGYISGVLREQGNPSHAIENYLRLGDSDTNLLPQALRTPYKVQITGVNSDGIVIGNRYTEDGGSGFYYDVKSGQLHDFNRLPTQTPRDQLVIYGINSLGQAVGTAVDSTGQRAVYYPSLSSAPIDLQNSLLPNTNWSIALASGINDHGQIVGLGATAGYHGGIVRLDPYPVPEPTTTIFFGLMALSAAARIARNFVPRLQQRSNGC
ncbi:MAG: hypothetical protein U0800_14110 [Isosphaeraceae bacterium]